MFTDVKFLQLENAELSIFLTLLGIVIVVRKLHRPNAFLSILTTLSGIFTDVIEVSKKHFLQYL